MEMEEIFKSNDVLRNIFEDVNELMYKEKISHEQITVTLSPSIFNAISSWYRGKVECDNQEWTLFGCHVSVDENARYDYYSVGKTNKVLLRTP